jgi:regulator of protease activity HflC (stomatin/prohibitin superfamily)
VTLAGADAAVLLARIAELEAALAQTTSGGVIELSDQRVLQDVGIYRYHHPLESAAAYKERPADLEGQIDEIVRAARAVLAADLFTFDGSLAKGRKMVADLSKLMLRAYNAEADNCVTGSLSRGAGS